jgi:hypothetical protein
MVASVDATIQEPVPADPPLNFINGCSLGVVRRDFLEELGMDIVHNYLFIGDLFGPDGHSIENWLTFRGKLRLIIRGTKNVSYRQCSECGRVVYFAMGKRYLYPAPPEHVELFESHLNGLILHENLFSRLNLARWPKVTVDALSVLSKPKDSLGTLV